MARMCRQCNRRTVHSAVKSLKRAPTTALTPAAPVSASCRPSSAACPRVCCRPHRPRPRTSPPPSDRLHGVERAAASCWDCNQHDWRAASKKAAANRQLRAAANFRRRSPQRSPSSASMLWLLRKLFMKAIVFALSSTTFSEAFFPGTSWQRKGIGARSCIAQMARGSNALRRGGRPGRELPHGGIRLMPVSIAYASLPQPSGWTYLLRGALNQIHAGR